MEGKNESPVSFSLSDVADICFDKFSSSTMRQTVYPRSTPVVSYTGCTKSNKNGLAHVHRLLHPGDTDGHYTHTSFLPSPRMFTRVSERENE